MILLAIVCLALVATDIPDGSLIFASSGSIGRVAERLVENDNRCPGCGKLLTNQPVFIHVGIIFDGVVYESDWPVSRAAPLGRNIKHGLRYYIYSPTVPYSAEEIRKMKCEATRQLNKPYQLKNYFWPRTAKTYGTWCSPFVGSVLNASGRYRLTPYDLRDPTRLFRKVSHAYKSCNGSHANPPARKGCYSVSAGQCSKCSNGS